MLVLGYLIALWPVEQAALVVLGAIFLLSVLLRPDVPLYVLAFSVPFASLRQVSIGPFGLSLTDALVGLMLGSWLARGLLERSVRVVWPRKSTWLLVFLGAGLISFASAASLRLSVIEWLKWAEMLVVYVFVSQMDYRSDSRSPVAWLLPLCLIAAGVGEGLLGIYQFARQVGPPAFILFGRFMRAHGTLRQPNPYAGYLGLTLPIAIGFVVSCGPWSDFAARWKRVARIGLWLFVLMGSIIMVLALAVSWSRGAWVGAAAAAAVICLRKGWRWTAVALLAIVVAAGLWFSTEGVADVPAAILGRLGGQDIALSAAFGPPEGLQAIEVTDENWATLERLAHWHAAWKMWLDRPWLGVGIGNYALVYPQYALPRWGDPLGHAHNHYLNVAAESGLVGLAAYLVLVVTWIWWAWRLAQPWSGRGRPIPEPPASGVKRWMTENYSRGLALGGLGVLMHLAVHTLFDNLLVAGMYVQIGMVLGLCELAGRNRGQADR